MIQVGAFNILKVARRVEFGVFLDDGAQGILLPKRFVPANLEPGDEIAVFIYHDGEDRLIATTQKPIAVVGEIARLRVVNTTPQGAFMNLGLMKDIFVPRSQQISRMRVHGDYLVHIYVDEKTGRMAASEKFEHLLNNQLLTVTEGEEVQLMVYRKTDIGFLCIINHRHTGVLHFNEIFRPLSAGDSFKGYIKRISPSASKPGQFNIDLGAGQKGYARVSNEAGTILQLLEENGGFLPYGDKTDPETIYSFFGMSKKVFKMSIGQLFRERRITIIPEGIRLNS